MFHWKNNKIKECSPDCGNWVDDEMHAVFVKGVEVTDITYDDNSSPVRNDITLINSLSINGIILFKYKSLLTGLSCRI